MSEYEDPWLAYWWSLDDTTRERMLMMIEAPHLLCQKEMTPAPTREGGAGVGSDTRRRGAGVGSES